MAGETTRVEVWLQGVMKPPLRRETPVDGSGWAALGDEARANFEVPGVLLCPGPNGDEPVRDAAHLAAALAEAAAKGRSPATLTLSRPRRKEA